MTKKDKKAIEEAFVRISAKDPHCSSCIFRTEWESYKYIDRKVIENIKAEIQAIEINGQVDEHTMFIRTGEQIKNMALEIIDKHISRKENDV